jgi:hypothetical protein
MADLTNWRFNYVPEVGARELLQGEQYGFAIDATTYDTDTAAAYVGGPVGGTLAIHADNVTDKPNIPMDAAAGLLKGASPLVQSGTSPKMVHFPSSPYVRWTPHNLHTYSEVITSATWTLEAGTTHTADAGVAPDGKTTAERITPGTGNSNKQAYKDVGLSANVSGYTFSLYVKSDGGQWIGMGLLAGGADASGAGCFFDVSNGVVGTATGCTGSIESVGSGWYRCSVFDTGAQYLVIEAHSADAQAKTWNSAASAEKFLVWGAQINRGPIATPYLITTSAARIGIPQSYDTAAAQYGMLVEPAATNLILRSEDIATTWTAGSGVTINTNDTTAPDGSSTADRYTYSGADEYISQDVSNAAAPQSFSLYAKASTGAQWLMIVFWNGIGNGSQFWFDILNGAVGGTASFGGGWTPSNIAITSVGNGWYRCSGTSTTAGGTTQFKINSATADTTDTRDTSFVAWLWGMQVETGSVATSLIPTLSSTVTRATDQPGFLNSSISFSDTAGSVIEYGKPLFVDTTAQPAWWEISNGAVSERILMYQDNTGSGTARMYMVDNTTAQVAGAGVAPGTNDTMTAGTAFKSGCAWAANDLAHVKDNGTAGTDGAATLPTVTTGYLGWTPIAVAGINGLIYQFTYLPRRMTNAELQAKTS